MKKSKIIGIGLFVACLLMFSGKIFGDERLIYATDFTNLEDWYRVIPNSPAGDPKIENNSMALGTGSVGILLKKELPEEFILSVKAKSERFASDEEFKGRFAWIKIQLYVHAGNRGEENPDFYDICFDPERKIVYVYKYTQLPPGEPSTWRETMKLVSEKSKINTKLGQWYDIRVEVLKEGFGVCIDGEEIASVQTLDKSFLKGTIGLLGGQSGSLAYFKDLVIKKP